mgnify:CR=1 FL=1
MKKIVYYLCAAAAIGLSGCQDEITENSVIPAKTGDEITFGSSLTDIEEQTRTIYGDEPKTDDNGTYYPVTWEDGDQIAIYCPEASNGNMVYYKVTPDGKDASHSSAVTKVNPDQAGLQWGQKEEHHFSAFYPADRIVGLQNGKITAEIPVQQTPLSWKSTRNDAGGTTYTGVANTDYAFMWAYNTHNKSDGGDVALNFKPWVTILDVEINGPETADAAIKMSAVQLVSTTGETLNGQFTMDFTAVENDRAKYPTYEQAGEPNATRSMITIQLYDQSLNGGQGDFITLKHGDKIVVRFYLLPKDTNYDTSARQDLQLRVAPYNSAVLVRTLNAAAGSDEGTQEGGILAHKVNKVILPSVSKTGPNYWMSSLDPNIYLTELSLPGSKFSYQNTTDQTNVSTHYQSLSVADQIKNGIRAFHVQTIGDNVDSDGPSRRDNGGNANSMELKISVAENKTSIGLKDMVKTIAQGLKDAEDYGKYGEYAFILLTYSGNGSEGFGRVYNGWGDYSWQVAPAQAWMQAVKNDLAEMAQDKDTYRLYTDEITPNTTLGQVAGHVIIKVNYNDDNMANYLATNDQVPALFSIWGLTDQTVRDDFEPTSAYAINMLRWGTSNHNAPADMKFFYHEASSVGHEESESDKKNNIIDMWNRSINYYKTNSNHDMWFMNDVGGYYYGIHNAPASESQIGIEGWTEYIGPIATEYLQDRTEDATLGIVLLNYADPNNQYSGNLIQTIINNNFSFQLRTSGSSSQSNTYNAAYSKGGNAIGWDK